MKTHTMLSCKKIVFLFLLCTLAVTVNAMQQDVRREQQERALSYICSMLESDQPSWVIDIRKRLEITLQDDIKTLEAIEQVMPKIDHFFHSCNNFTSTTQRATAFAACGLHDLHKVGFYEPIMMTQSLLIHQHEQLKKMFDDLTHQYPADASKYFQWLHRPAYNIISRIKSRSFI